MIKSWNVFHLVEKSGELGLTREWNFVESGPLPPFLLHPASLWSISRFCYTCCSGGCSSSPAWQPTDTCPIPIWIPALMSGKTVWSHLVTTCAKSDPWLFWGCFILYQVCPFIWLILSHLSRCYQEAFPEGIPRCPLPPCASIVSCALFFWTFWE